MHCSFKTYASFKACLFLLILFSTRAFSQLVAVPLDERVGKADVIFEGKVLDKTSMWDDTHKQIYTTNVVAVYKVFKGQLTATQVEIITYGGVVGKDMETVSHSLQLEVGDVGVFTAIVSPVKLSKKSGMPQFKAYAGLQGFIKYDLNKHTAADPFNHYKSITEEVYPSITKRTKASVLTIKKADYKVE